MKDSGMIRLKYVVDIFGRIGFRGYTEQDLVDENEGAITLSPSNIQNMKMDYSKCSFLTWQKYYESPEIKIKNGDVLFVKTGSTYGKVGYVENLPMEATINPQLVVFKNISMNSKLLFYMLQMSFVKDQCELAVVGGTIPTMSQVKIGNIYIPFPSLVEQQRIAEFLDRECGKIDGLKADIQAQIDTLEQYKRSVITEAVTHSLNPSAPMKDSGISWVGEIPREWSVKKIKHISYVIGGNGFNVELQGLESGDYPFCKASDISNAGKYLDKAANYVTFDIVRDQHYNIIPKGAILFPKIGEAMKKNNRTICVLDCCADNNCQAIVPFERNSGMFLYYILTCVNMGWFDNAGTIPCMNNRKFLNSKVPFPPLDEQQEIADYLDNKCAEIEQIIADKKSQIETLDGYKKSLIYEYVTGKKEVV